MMTIQSIFRTVAFGLLFTLIGGISVWGQDWKAYSPGSVWVLEGGQGIKFHPNGTVSKFSTNVVDTPLSTQNNASLYFPKYGNYVFTDPYRKFIQLPVSPPVSDMYAGINIRDSSGKIIEGGDSLYGYWGRCNGSIFIPLNDSVAYFFSIGSSVKRYIGNGREFAIYFICKSPFLYATKILCNQKGIRVVDRERLVLDIDLVDAITAVKHANGKDWWVVTHERNASNGFILLLVSERGIERQKTQYIGSVRCPGYKPIDDCGEWVVDGDPVGQMNFNPAGDKLACVSGYGKPILDVFDFDRCTGLLSNYNNLLLNQIGYTQTFPLGCSLSPEGENLLISYNFRKEIDVISVNVKNKRFSPQITTFGITSFSYLPYDSVIACTNRGTSITFIRNSDSKKMDEIIFDTSAIKFLPERQIGFLPNTANYLLPPLPYDFNVDRHPVAYRDTLCMYDSTSLGGWYPAGKHLHRWSPSAGLSSDTAYRVTFRPPVVNKNDTVYTFILHTEGRVGGCLEGQSAFDTLNVFVYGNGRGGCRTVSRLDAIPPQVIQIYPNPTNGTLYIKSSWERMDKVMLFTMVGKLVFERNLSATEAELFVGDLSDGVYLCKITTTEGIFTQKLMIKK